ncbi:hypothetical protein [Chroogloeocystis siderophila]|uniref:Uncharacterized protein n=1 Tax=Chroogloeocystis siderophila 5.2 s.c.1 TaxID=247279 RepID=A0A1U7HQF6_9CHRO|nr:hypothetical protein [Chroogloeocystis siderophila]OKH25822.1 hypothetical protein NIES1031_12580 [Chroogloeocystis siderophila 5.2 s.c.1]
MTGCNVVQPLLLASCDESIIKLPTTLKRCSELPQLAEAEQLLHKHRAFIEKIEKENQRLLFIDLYKTPLCPNKAIIKIEYGGDSACEPIKQTIGKTFFGIPYILING